MRKAGGGCLSERSEIGELPDGNDNAA